MTGNLYTWLFEAPGHEADRVFLDCPGKASISYRAMDTLSGRYAAAMTSLGVVPGDRIIAQVEKSAEAVALYLACVRLGAVYVPLNTAYTAAETMYFLTDCQPRLVVVSPPRQDELRRSNAGAQLPAMLTLTGGADSLADRAAACQPFARVVPRGDGDLASIIYTSGTTGRAKGAMLTVGNLKTNGQALHDVWGWQDEDVLLHALPIFHVHGLFVALHCAMLGGSRVVFLPRFDVAQVLAVLPAVTVMMGVPTFYTRLLAEPDLTPEACRRMRVFISGSAPLSPRTFAQFEARTGHKILERYGMSEAGIITSNPLRGVRLPGTVGFSLPGVEVRVAGGDAVGELEVRGPNLFAGYWGMPQKTAAEFRGDGFFKTGDLARVDADGRVSIVGRARDLIISGGYNIYPREIEGRLDSLQGIVESAVVGVPHPDLGEAVVAVIVAEHPDSFDSAAVAAALADTLARFKQPKRYFLVDALPRNAMGKVQKNRLQERYGSAFS